MHVYLLMEVVIIIITLGAHALGRSSVVKNILYTYALDFFGEL